MNIKDHSTRIQKLLPKDYKSQAILHGFWAWVDNEGYITLEDAIMYSEAEEEKDFQNLVKAKLISIKGSIIGKIVKVHYWLATQRLSPSRFTESDIKQYWPDAATRHDSLPVGWEEYKKKMEQKKKEFEEKMRKQR